MGGKTVNVILNSNNAISGSTNSNATYNVDWGAMLKDNTPYRLHWTYVGQPNTFTAATKLAQVQINFTMEQYLNKVDYIYTEVNSDYVYEKCAIVGELDEYLLKFGLHRVETKWCENYRWGDAFYIRK